MYSVKLVLACLAASGLYLLLASMLLHWIGTKLRVTEGIAPSLFEKDSVGWGAMNFIVELIFYVVVPTISYSFFYLVVPFTGVRAGLAAAVFAFTLGAAPALMTLSLRIKIPMPYILFQMLSIFIKLSGSMIIIGYLYAL